MFKGNAIETENETDYKFIAKDARFLPVFQKAETVWPAEQNFSAMRSKADNRK